MSNTIITGERVTLRSATIEAFAVGYYWEYEEEKQEATKCNSHFAISEKVTKDEFIEEWNGYEIFPNVSGILVVEADGEIIGEVDADWIDKHNNWLEVGIVIYKPKYWGGGYGSEACRLYIDHIFSNTTIHRLGATTWSGNIRMIKTAQKIGMKEEACIREVRTVDGKYYDAIKMGILRSEWESTKQI